MRDVLVYICCTFLNSWFLFLFFFLYSTATEQLRNLHNPISARFYICTQFTRLHSYIPSELAIELSPSQEQPSSTSIHPNCHLLRPNLIHTPPQTRSSKHQSISSHPPNHLPTLPITRHNVLPRLLQLQLQHWRQPLHPPHNRQQQHQHHLHPKHIIRQLFSSLLGSYCAQ